ncbi:MAG TPA: endonuclease/exonuclease/phosphatase family protein [Mycobacteriales bacterium]|nr:endonuclease/exonuclease/phosphatase family protein [Mycobacteriales bacterium]
MAPAGRPRLRRRARLLLGVSLAWLLYVPTHLLLSGRWWVWAIPDLLPPLTFLAVPLLLLAAAPLARPAGRWVAAAAVLTLVLGAGLAGLNPRALVGGGDGPAPAGALRVLSWNTGVWDHGDDPDHFYGFLRAQRADVYLLQEYEPPHSGGRAGGTAEQRAAEVAADVATLRRNSPGFSVIVRGELVTLTRLPIVTTTALPAELPGADWRTVYERSKALRTDVRVGGRTVSIYNVHIPIQIGLGRSAFSTATRDRFADRRRQYRALADDIAGNPNPVLVAGDFNTSPSMGELRTLRGRLRDAIRADGALIPTSWPVGVPVLPRLWRLDWALATPSVAVHEYARLDPQGMSDHRADRLTISLRDAG